jgi:transposase-like protein
MKREPKTLQEAIVYFANPANCREYLVARRWPNGVTCPRCGSDNVLFLEKYNRWHCRQKHTASQFTLKTGTIFEDSPIGLDKWLTAMWQIVNCKNGVSSYEIGKAIGVTQKSAWFMDHRIRLALQNGSLMKLGGIGDEVEVDETFIGGKARNMHRDVHKRRFRVPGDTGDKAIVFGILDRKEKKVRTMVVANRKAETVQPLIKEHVNAGALLFTDDMRGYIGMPKDFVHRVVDHAERYVDGKVHTNGLENFWSLLKRGLHGTYVSVEPFHLFRYLDEQVFRYDNRGTKDKPVTDADRFDLAIRQIVGKRLMYKELTGKMKDGEISAEPL